jgi:hypothetical protein
MSPAGLEPAIPAIVRPQTHALDRAATGIGRGEIRLITCIYLVNCSWILGFYQQNCK